MGFKDDASFLRYLTMGAEGTRKAAEQLTDYGLKPIELERYSASNKIWETKVKRLRLPDLLCVKTGLRVEVRAKSNLSIRMSHAPNNPERHWDSGLRPTDLVALVACICDGSGVKAAGPAEFFSVRDLQRSQDEKQISSRKSASEGAERHIEWKSKTSSRPGNVLAVTSTKIVVLWDADEARVKRHQSYDITGIHPYVKINDRVVPNTFIAGAPEKKEDPKSYLKKSYDPVAGLNSKSSVDQYVAAKAIPFRPDIHALAKPSIERMVGRSGDKRLALEIAGAAASLGLSSAIDFLRSTIFSPGTGENMRMEATFIVTEIGVRNRANWATDVLTEVASNRLLFGDKEVRQAAVWGMGHSGLKTYAKLIGFLGDPDDKVAMHAIAGFGNDASKKVVDAIVNVLLTGNKRESAGALEALLKIGGDVVVQALAEAASTSQQRRPWVIATLGRLPAQYVTATRLGSELFTEIQPVVMAAGSANWLAPLATRQPLATLMNQKSLPLMC